MERPGHGGRRSSSSRTDSGQSLSSTPSRWFASEDNASSDENLVSLRNCLENGPSFPVSDDLEEVDEEFHRHPPGSSQGRSTADPESRGLAPWATLKWRSPRGPPDFPASPFPLMHPVVAGVSMSWIAILTQSWKSRQDGRTDSGFRRDGGSSDPSGRTSRLEVPARLRTTRRPEPDDRDRGV